MVGNSTRHITDDISPQMKILNMAIPILMHFLTCIRQRHRIEFSTLDAILDFSSRHHLCQFMPVVSETTEHAKRFGA